MEAGRVPSYQVLGALVKVFRLPDDELVDLMKMVLGIGGRGA